jgi:outer membrane lipoprotein SlyB
MSLEYLHRKTTMNNHELPTNLQDVIIPPPQPSEEPAQDSSIAKTLGAVGGGVAGAAIGRSLIGGKLGTAIGVVAGAVAGGMTGDKLADLADPTTGWQLGSNDDVVNLPAHYTWAELQALSKSQV